MESNQEAVNERCRQILQSVFGGDGSGEFDIFHIACSYVDGRYQIEFGDKASKVVRSFSGEDAERILSSRSYASDIAGMIMQDWDDSWDEL